MPRIICNGAQNKGFKGADAVVTTGMQIGGKKMSRYIDVEEAFEVLTDYYHQRTLIQKESLKEALDRVPTADVVEVRHGKWITMSDADGIYWACSECGEDIPRISHYNPKFNLFPRLKSIDRTNFCPNCGAKMDL